MSTLRYTGEWPPLEVLGQYPNWESALDEEDVAGQDETTIRPSMNQVSLHPDVTFTAGRVTQADGKRLPAILELIGEIIVGVTVHREGDWAWTLRREKQDSWLSVDLESALEPRRPAATPAFDPAALPLVVETLLPASMGGPRLHISIDRVERWEP